MALPSVRMEYRIQLSHVDRGLETAQTVVAALHPSETMEHMTLRVLAWCLLYEEGLGFGPGLGDPEAADLWAHDLTGRLRTWIECGTADADKLRRVLQHNSDAQVHAVFNGERRQRELLEQIAGQDRTRAWKGAARVTLWQIDEALVAALAAREGRRHRLAVTVVGDHLYIDADGQSVDGAAARSALP